MKPLGEFVILQDDEGRIQVECRNGKREAQAEHRPPQPDGRHHPVPPRPPVWVAVGHATITDDPFVQSGKVKFPVTDAMSGTHQLWRPSSEAGNFARGDKLCDAEKWSADDGSGYNELRSPYRICQEFSS